VNPFAFTRAADTASALLAIGQERGARFIAGGTNILDFMKEGVETPPLLIDINALPLRSIERRPGELFIGALARMSDVAADEHVRSAYPMVAIALDQSASPQLRNMASIGGNLLQRTRCQYFRDTATPCNKRAPRSGCSALEGTNRKEAVLGTSEFCIAAHASDLAVALAALDASVHVHDDAGEHVVPLSEFYRLPGSTPHIENALSSNQLLGGVSIPLLPFAARSTYLKVRDRAQYDFALASAAVALDVSAGVIRNARVALGGIATIPWRSREAENALVNHPATRETFAKAADAALGAARGHGENDFKIPLAKRTLVRALEIVTERA
jgi:xanthine dehydrogenase YagS FAD-binding subunit